MNIKIYQINAERDVNHLMFLSMFNLKKQGLDEKVNSEIYDLVFEGDVNAFNLEDVYFMFNSDVPHEYKGRSLSVSDVVEVSGDENIKDGFYFCDRFGFKSVEFDKTVCQNILSSEEMRNLNINELRNEFPEGTAVKLTKMENEPQMYEGLKGVVTSVDDIGQIHVKWENGSTLALNTKTDIFEKDTLNQKLTVLFVEPKKFPKEIQIDDTLEAMQELVDGYIEEYMPFEDEVALICNEEGKSRKMPLNRAIYGDDNKISDIIAGSFFIVKAPMDSEKYESLSKDLIEKYSHKFKYPERFAKVYGEIKAIPYNPSRDEKDR